MILVYKTNHKTGFTLIELLVVMAISGVLMAFVGPVAVEQIDSSNARVEVETIKAIIRRSSNESFTKGLSSTLVFQENKVLKVGVEDKNKQFSYIAFPTQKVHFNRNGYPDKTTLYYKYKGSTHSLKVYALLGFKDNEFIYAP